jgi:hypothetical protein
VDLTYKVKEVTRKREQRKWINGWNQDNMNSVKKWVREDPNPKTNTWGEYEKGGFTHYLTCFSSSIFFLYMGIYIYI